MHTPPETKAAREAARRAGDIVREARERADMTRRECVDKASELHTRVLSEDWWKRLETGARSWILPWEVKLVSETLDIPIIKLRQALGWEE